MSEEYKTSPYRRYKNDVETGSSGFDEDDNTGPFDILRTKSASVDRLKRWRQAALVLNASRRFRYTLDLKKEEEKKQIIAKIRTHAQVIRAAYLFQAAGQQVSGLDLAMWDEHKPWEEDNSDPVHRTMKTVHSNIENLPLDVIGMLMKLLLPGGFKDCFNFFLAWAQTQRPAVILSFLNDFPLREMYKFGDVGSATDKAYFNRFFGIAERLGVADAILYRRCREILCGVGDINDHLTVIDGLVRHGHFTSMVASFSLRNTYKKESITRSFHFISGIFKHREFKDGIVPVLVNLGSIIPFSGRNVFGIEAAFVGGGCHLHSGKETTKGEIESTGVVDCFFCAVGFILNVFSREVGNF